MPLVNIDIQMGEAQLAEITTMLDGVPNGVQRVATRAINKIAVSARTHIVRRIVQEVNLKSSEVRNRNVSISKAKYSRLAAMIRISGRRIPLLRWGARQTRKGASYAIRRGGRTVLAHGFLASMSSGHAGAFIRRTGKEALKNRRLTRFGFRSASKRDKWLYRLSPAERQKALAREAASRARQQAKLAEQTAAWKELGEERVGRLPIAELRGPSVPAVMENIAELSAEVLDERLATQFEGEIDNQVGLVLARRGLGSG